MTQKKSTAGVRSAPRSSTDGDRPAIRNEILLDLPRTERSSILSKLEFIKLPARTVLTEMGEPIRFAYFLNAGVASIVTVMSDGKSVEVGLTGKEGFIGLPVIVGYTISPTRALIQIAGEGLKLSVADLKQTLRTCPKLLISLQRYSQELAIQAVQIAACNRLHEVNKRLARWLLMCQDRVGEASFQLTQEFVAHMLGTRRASVTVAAGNLQKAGLITYRRGQVTVEKREKLEEAACECYQTLKRQLSIWHRESA